MLRILGACFVLVVYLQWIDATKVEEKDLCLDKEKTWSVVQNAIVVLKGLKENITVREVPSHQDGGTQTPTDETALSDKRYDMLIDLLMEERRSRTKLETAVTLLALKQEVAKCQCCNSDMRTYQSNDNDSLLNETKSLKEDVLSLQKDHHSLKSQFLTASHLRQEILNERRRDCADVKSDEDGKYEIYPLTGSHQKVPVYCIMEQDKKWTVIQRRYNGSVAFTRNWTEYKHGFGNVEGEYWLGNDLIHSITRNGHHELSIHLVDSQGRHGYANYSTFSIGDETSQYVLHIGGYTGNVGDNLDKFNPTRGTLNGKKFYTGDRRDSKGCASTIRGGWWYNYCFYANLNRQYGAINWENWSSKIKQTIMMIRRV